MQTCLISFVLQREHNETLAKLHFVLALSDCVLELAGSRGTPLAALTESVNLGGGGSPNGSSNITGNGVISEGARRAEQLVLLVRALQLLSSGLSLATQQIRAGHLQPSSSVKSGALYVNLSILSLCTVRSGALILT